MAGADVVLNIVDPGVVLNIAQTALGPAGGDLTGSYPNPSVSPLAISYATDIKGTAQRAATAHEVSLLPHGGRFPERQEVRAIADETARRVMSILGAAVPTALTADQVRAIATESAMRACTQISNSVPTALTTDQVRAIAFEIAHRFLTVTTRAVPAFLPPDQVVMADLFYGG